MKYLLLLLSFNVYGAELIIEQGRATTWFSVTEHYTPATYGAVGLRTNESQFFEILQGAWEGENNAQFGSLSYGLRTKDKYFAELSLGAVQLFNANTTQLNGDKQILITIGIGTKFDNLFITARLRHFSNAGTQGDNHGFEVFVGSLGVQF